MNLIGGELQCIWTLFDGIALCLGANRMCGKKIDSCVMWSLRDELTYLSIKIMKL